MQRPSSRVPGARDRGTLLTLGACSELIYLLYFVPRFPLLPNVNRDRFIDDFLGPDLLPLLGLLAVTVALFALYGLAWREVRLDSSRETLWIILGFSVVFALTMTFVYPATAFDVFKYLASGRLLVHYHENPMVVTPLRHPADPIMAATDGLRFSADPYGPLGITIDSIPAIFTGGSLLAGIIALKLLASAWALLDACLVYAIVRQIGGARAVGAALLVAWNPFVLFEMSASGHNDAALMAFVLLGVLLMVRGRFTLGAVTIGVSALVKPGPALILPLVLLYGAVRLPASRRVRYVAVSVAVLVAAVVIAYALFWHGIGTFNAMLANEHIHDFSFSAVAGDWLHGGNTAGWASLVGRLLLVPLFLYLLWQGRRCPAALLRASYIALFGFLMLAANSVRGWYLLWPIVLAAAVPDERDSRWVILCSCLAMIGSLLYADGFNMGLTAHLGNVDTVPYVVTFLPTGLSLIGLFVARWRGWKRESLNGDVLRPV